jgi:hypothetical protein
MRVWVVCPVFHDVATFRRLRREVTATIALCRRTLGLASPPSDVRFVVVDDSSGDDPQVSTLAHFTDVEVVTPPFNVGHQRALVFGLRAIAARVDDSEWIITMDADGEDAPADIPALFRGYAERAASSQSGNHLRTVVLARRTSRRETWPFKVMYALFRILCRLLTGQVVRTGNFALYRGWCARNLLLHPTFDVCYSASLLRLANAPVLVPCARAPRYDGRSKMTYVRLVSHGLSMLVPFADIVATRLFVALSLACLSSVTIFAGLLLDAIAFPSSVGWVEVSGVIAIVFAVLAGSCLLCYVGFHLLAQTMLSSRLTALAADTSRRHRGAL